MLVDARPTAFSDTSLPLPTDVHQLHLITDILGTPTDEDLKGVGSDKARRYVKTLGHKPKVPLGRLFAGATPLAIDLLERMLTFDPEKRITVGEALAHPYLAALHDPTDEPEAPGVFDFEFERVPMTKQLLKEWVYRECLAFHGVEWDGPSGVGTPRDVAPSQVLPMQFSGADAMAIDTPHQTDPMSP